MKPGGTQFNSQHQAKISPLLTILNDPAISPVSQKGKAEAQAQQPACPLELQ